MRVRSPRILASFNTIGDGDLWLFWCPWWHFIKNRLVAIVFYGAYVNWQGIQNAQKQELFLTTRIDNDTYIVVMTDGDEAILEKDRTGKDGKLKICKDKYMKVDCKNLLLEKKKYRRAIGDGE